MPLLKDTKMSLELKQIIDAVNVAALLDEKELTRLSYLAVQGYEADEDSRRDWKQRNKKGMDLAMQVAKPKSRPFEDPANVMYPLISISSIQFSARAYPNLIPGYDIVRAKVIGSDEDGGKANKAQRVETHLNYQLNEEMPEWEEETDRLLTVLPIIGCCFKKTYWSQILKRNVSRYVSPLDLIMHYKAENMETVPRITEKYRLYPNEMVERIRSGRFIDFDYGRPQKPKDDDEVYTATDEYRPHLFLEQHTWFDLDDDGYAEPYIVNIHADTKKIVRIVPRFSRSDIHLNDRLQVERIEAFQHYTKFTFMHSPDGSIYDLGFGSLLAPINDTVNATINQTLDAGTWSNTPTGLITKNISLAAGKHGGPVELQFGKFLPVAYTGDELRKNIIMANEFIPPPSLVTFNLLGFMVEAGQRLSSVGELMQGEQSIHNEPATTSLARIEQGQKVFSAIHKRLWNSFNAEFKKLFILNATYLEDNRYSTILDAPGMQRGIAQSDYDKESCDIIPTASPDDVSRTQELVKAEMLMGLRGQGLNDGEIMKRLIQALHIANPETILQSQPPPPDPKVVLESEKLDLERDKLEFEMMKFGYEMAKIQSETIKNLAQAEAAEIGPQLDQYIAEMNALVKMGTQQRMKRPSAGAQEAMPATEGAPMMAEEAPMGMVENNGGGIS